MVNVSRIATLDTDGNSILELQDYNLIDLYAAQLDEVEFDFLLNNYAKNLIELKPFVLKRLKTQVFNKEKFLGANPAFCGLISSSNSSIS